MAFGDLHAHARMGSTLPVEEGSAYLSDELANFLHFTLTGGSYRAARS